MVFGMTDIFTKEKRSEVMSKIRGRDTSIEVKVRKYLFSKGFRYRKNDRRYPGSPDILLPKYHMAIFVNGCFWHGHEACGIYKEPKTRSKFWHDKIERNRERDKENEKLLRDSGWNVLVVWECELKKDFVGEMEDLVNQIEKGEKELR